MTCKWESLETNTLWKKLSWKWLHDETANKKTHVLIGWFLRALLDSFIILISNLPETNIAPARRPSQKETSFSTIYFQGLC